MKATDIPPATAAGFLFAIVERQKAAQERQPFVRFRTVVHISREEARVLFAGMKWLEAFEAWGFGVEDTDPTIVQVIKWLAGQVDQLKGKADGEMTMLLDSSGIAMITAAAQHLDRYALTRAVTDGRGARKKR